MVSKESEKHRREEFEKNRASIWAKYEREYGNLIAQEIRDQVEEDIIRVSTDDEETLEDLDVYLSDNIPIWENILLKGGASPATDSTKPTNRYRKCFERRFYLVNFVIDRPYKRGTRIDWKRMVTEWNKSHPSDPMSLSALRVEYQRAIKEDSLMLQVRIIRNNQILTSFWQPLQKQLRDMANNNPFGFVIASLASQNLWNDTQPLMLYLNQVIKNSPMFKEFEAHYPEEAARIESELEAIVNMGDIKALVEYIDHLDITKEANHERSHNEEGQE